MLTCRMRTVFLFDIDGTLVNTGAGRTAMVGAFAESHGREDVFEGVSFAGMTDRAIIRGGLRAIGEHAVTEQAIDRVLEAYLGLLEHHLALDAYRILPGAAALVRSLVDLPEIAVGLGTGNVKRGAYAKLTPGALHDAFTFGGFGCDAEARAELLQAGAERGARQLGVSLDACRVVVIGDTPKDVAAAHAIGASCIGVGTGSFTTEDLRACGAERAFATLEDAAVRDALLEGA